ncbi:MAG: 6-phospho-3-hexuloisomerase [Propionicimonas sp.]|nr:6-phospho-3-hexuloisomerase [Propionicimonas sp.]
MMGLDLPDTRTLALESVDNLRSTVATAEQAQLAELETAILAASRVFVSGAGRSLLAMRFFAMRLMHIDIRSYIVGEVTTPSIQPGDLLVLASGSGRTDTQVTLARKAKQQGASVALVTAADQTAVEIPADHIVHVQVRPVRGDLAGIVPAGNVFEQSVVVVLDAVISSLMARTGTPLSRIMGNHANLE